jgi:hypothetical protein
MKTYWLEEAVIATSSEEVQLQVETSEASKHDRLIDWVTEVLSEYIKKIVSPLTWLTNERRAPFIYALSNNMSFRCTGCKAHGAWSG